VFPDSSQVLTSEAFEIISRLKISFKSYKVLLE
jgi:hypothetical protein